MSFPTLTQTCRGTGATRYSNEVSHRRGTASDGFTAALATASGRSSEDRSGRTDSAQVQLRNEIPSLRQDSARTSADDSAPTQRELALNVPLSIAVNPFNQTGGMVRRAAADTTPVAEEPDPEPAVPIDVFREALAKLGIDSEKLTFVERKFQVTGPLGSYDEHDICVEYADGRKVPYAVDLMLKNPSITACEVQTRLAKDLAG